MSRCTSVILIIVLLAGCRKIDVPANHLKELFGEWTLIESGGPTGPCWPPDKSIWVEFKQNGKQKIHEKGKLTQTRRFVFKESETSPQQTFVIVYDEHYRQQFKISGDTLLLWDVGVSHGCMHQFTRR